MPRPRRPSVRKVFLSSTARDLGPYRDAVYKAISGLDGYKCIRMEDFGARDREADPSASGPRVLRGGSVDSYARLVRCAARSGADPLFRLRYLGFRVVLLPFSSDL